MTNNNLLAFKPCETDLFNLLLSEKLLTAAFDVRFAKSQSKGVDRLSGVQFFSRAGDELKVASRKAIDGSYRFSPYLEHLKVKGRGKEPRVVGIPCIRDRIVLHQLNQFLGYIFPECIRRNIANSYIRDISADLNSHSVNTTFVCGVDIQKFYDTIIRDKLKNILSKRIKNIQALNLIMHAINTPTVPKNSRRHTYSSYKEQLGIPQGLAISNILAAIYLHDVDAAMSNHPVKYYRYVDDILMYGNEQDLRKAYTSLSIRLGKRGLALHGTKSGKSHFASLDNSFGYLGYSFKWPRITVRDSTIERLMQSITSKFSDHMHNKEKRLEKFNYLDASRLSEIFILELNEKITGAISKNIRYGWIAYFSQITDLSLLHRLDSMVAELFKRLPDFNYTPPNSLKKFSRAYFEMKFSPTGSYIKNYDVITSTIEMLTFLVERGRVDPQESLTDDQILERYERYLNRVLSEMQADEGMMY